MARVVTSIVKYKDFNDKMSPAVIIDVNEDNSVTLGIFSTKGYYVEFNMKEGNDKGNFIDPETEEQN